MNRRSFIKGWAGLALCPVCAAGAAASGPHWSYEGGEGPEHWGELSEDYKACAVGRGQSPIDIDRPIHADLPKLDLSYAGGFPRIENNGHTVQVDAQAGSRLVVGEDACDLVQFHFHHPSEHRLRGRSFPLECHFVHRREDGGLTVLAVLLEHGRANGTFEAILTHAPQEAGASAALTGLDVPGLLPDTTHYVRYSGSLTTPPCREGVDWIVLTTPVEVAEAQVARFASLYPHNARPVQPRNRRILLEI